MSFFSAFRKKEEKAEPVGGQAVPIKVSLTPKTYQNVKAKQGDQKSEWYQPLYDFEYKCLPEAMENEGIAGGACAHKLDAEFFMRLANYVFNVHQMTNPLTHENFSVEYDLIANILICYVDIDFPVERVLAHALIFTVKIDPDGHLTPKLFFVENDMFSDSPVIGSMSGNMHQNFGSVGCEKSDIAIRAAQIAQQYSL